MNGTISDVEEEVSTVIEENGPVPLSELMENSEYHANDVLFGILQSDLFAFNADLEVMLER